jgi:hypothetical protein
MWTMGLLFGHIWEISTHKKDMTADEIDNATGEQMEKNKQITSLHFWYRILNSVL